MLTYTIMTILLTVLLIFSFYNCQLEKRNKVFDLDDTLFLKYIFCFIIMLVHIPNIYTNKIQNIIGSFAYVGVTLFFMISSYGLKYNLENKKNYLKKFLRTRIPKLLIPAIFTNLVIFIFTICTSNFTSNSLFEIIYVDKWLLVLLTFYCIFYFVNKINKIHHKDITLIILIIIFSLIDKFTSFKITYTWPVESLGFAYGICLYNAQKRIKHDKTYNNRNLILKIVLNIIICMIFGILYLKFKNIFIIGDYFVRIILDIAIIILIIQLLKIIKFRNKIINFIGSISYEIYLLHRRIFKILVNLDLIHNSGMFILISFIIIILVSTVISKLSKLIQEKVKL